MKLIKQSSHQCGQWYQASSKKKKGMIRDEYPCVTGRFRLGQEVCKTLKKILAIFVVSEYFATLYPPDHDVMQNTGSVKSS